MNNWSIINYQGSKATLLDFISDNIKNYIDEGDCILDLFSGSSVVSNMLKSKYKVIANDSELYASIIASSVLTSDYKFNHIKVFETFNIFYSENYNRLYTAFNANVDLESELIKDGNTAALAILYQSLSTVWNNNNLEITPEKLRKQKDHNLFSYYYAGSYFGLSQAMQIDSAIYAISKMPPKLMDVLYSCLFYGMKEIVFSKDGHMAQPLSIDKYSTRHITQRNKSLLVYFRKKLLEYSNFEKTNINENEVYNLDFTELLSTHKLENKISMIYADPPYTDMQYSRYYHLLNVAANYNYPALTITSKGYTKGLYTEGRTQSLLSHRSSAKKQLQQLFNYCSKNNTKLALSFAYPQNSVRQATDRYTVTIEDLVYMAKKAFGHDKIEIKQVDYKHSNNRNSSTKRVIEYLILCGTKRVNRFYNIVELKEQLTDILPTNKNDMYNSHLYWSQKSFNICESLIKGLSEEGDVVFDPFMGSGVTVLESIKKGINRIGIGCDVNEMPIFIPHTLLDCCFEDNISESIDDFIKKIKSLITLYHTTCPKCGGHAIINSIIFDKPERTGEQIDIKTINYTCNECGKQTKEANTDDYDKINLSFPCENIQNIKLLQNSKIAVGNNDNISDIFTKRNFIILDRITLIINSYPNNIRRMLNYILMSVLHLCKITDKHSNSQWPLWIPKTDCVEKNIISVLEKKSNNLKKTISFVKRNYMEGSVVNQYSELVNNRCLLINKGSQFISEYDIPNDSVSLIITDPPYLEQVLYSEYMQLYAPFINLKYNLFDEIVVSSAQGRNKDKDSFFSLLYEVFAICADKLKLNGYMCLFFHDSNLEVWHKLLSILNLCGFRYISQSHIKKTLTLKNIISPKKSLNGDAVLFFINTKNKINQTSANEEIEEIEINLIREAKHLIRIYGSLTTPELYDKGLMEVLIQNGWLGKLSEKHDSLIELFEKHLFWDNGTTRWKMTEN